MAEITLRRARPDEAEKLAALHARTRRISMPYLPHLHTDEETVRWMTGFVVQKMEVWVAEADGEIAGYMALDGEMVDQLYVAPEFQNRGAGSLLLGKAKQIWPRGLALYCFAINAPARAFYEARGFVPVEFTDGERNEEHLPDVLYRWAGPI